MGAQETFTLLGLMLRGPLGIGEHSEIRCAACCLQFCFSSWSGRCHSCSTCGTPKDGGSVRSLGPSSSFVLLQPPRLRCLHGAMLSKFVIRVFYIMFQDHGPDRSDAQCAATAVTLQ